MEPSAPTRYKPWVPLGEFWTQKQRIQCHYGKYSMSKASFCELSDLYTLLARWSISHFMLRSHLSKRRNVSGLLLLVCWWVSWSVNFSFGYNGHDHEGGIIDTSCVCGGEGHWSQRSGNFVDFNISIYSAGHQCIRWGGDTLFRGIGHRVPWGRTP